MKSAPLVHFFFLTLPLGTENIVGGWVAIVVVVCGKICGKIEKLSDWNKNWCGVRYRPRDYDSGDKKTKKEEKNKKIKNKKNTQKYKKTRGYENV